MELTKLPLDFEQAKQIILSNENTVEIGLELKRLIKFATALFNDKDIKNRITQDTKLYLENNTSSEVTYQVTSSTYDYKLCNHKEYLELLSILDKIQKRLKQIENNELKPLLELVNQVSLFSGGTTQIEDIKKNIIVEFNHKYEMIPNGEEVITVYPPKHTFEKGLKYTV